MVSRDQVRAAFVVALTAAGLMAGPAAGAPPVDASAEHGWTGTWAASMMRPSPGFEPNWSEEGFANQTVRQVVRVSAGGALARIRLSNAFGTQPLTVTGATVARSAGRRRRAARIRAAPDVPGSRSVTIPAGPRTGQRSGAAAGLAAGHGDGHAVPGKPTGPATYHVRHATTYRATATTGPTRAPRRSPRPRSPGTTSPESTCSARRHAGTWWRPSATRSPTARRPQWTRTTATPTNWPNVWPRGQPRGVLNPASAATGCSPTRLPR